MTRNESLKEMLNNVYGAHPKSNFYNDMYIVNGNGTLELNGNRYPVTITNADRSWAECVPKFKANINSVTPMEKSSKLNDAFIEYCKKDVEQTRTLVSHRVPRIKNVLFREPATIVFWTDGTKTVVKADGEAYDPEKGLAMAISKKALGNHGNYYEEFKKWLPEDIFDSEDVDPIYPHLPMIGKSAEEASASFNKLVDSIVDLKKKSVEKPMTCREKLAMEHPEFVDGIYRGGCNGCPHDYEYTKHPEYCGDTNLGLDILCGRCWDRPVENKENKHEV